MTKGWRESWFANFMRKVDLKDGQNLRQNVKGNILEVFKWVERTQNRNLFGAFLDSNETAFSTEIIFPTKEYVI
jgi:hypothetical protein